MYFYSNVLSFLLSITNLNTDAGIRNRLKHLETVITHFWNRFYNEYTVALREKVLYNKRNRSDVPVSVGGIVLIKEDKDKVPRSKWKREKIERNLPSRDGIVRAVEVRVAGTKGTTTLLKRAIERLVPLEVKNQTNPTDQIQIYVNLVESSFFVFGSVLSMLSLACSLLLVSSVSSG